MRLNFRKSVNEPRTYWTSLRTSGMTFWMIFQALEMGCPLRKHEPVRAVLAFAMALPPECRGLRLPDDEYQNTLLVFLALSMPLPRIGLGFGPAESM